MAAPHPGPAAWRCHTLIHLFLAAQVLLGLFALDAWTPEVGSAVSSVTVVAWVCPADLVTAGIDAAALAAACTQPSDQATFALKSGEITRRRVASAGQPAIWPAVAGEFTLTIEDPAGEPAIVACEHAGTVTLYDGSQGSITGALLEDTELNCNWYRLAAPPAPEPTPIVPTVQPTPQPQPDTTGDPDLTGGVSTPGSGGDPSTGDFSGSIDIGGRSLYLTCFGSGTLTILLEAGGPGGTSDRWTNVISSVTPGYRVCAYDRAGLGRSDPPPTSDIRTMQDSVNDLRALILAARLNCPCVFVGESWGANIVRLYTGQNPSDVAGLVLIDPVPPGFLDDFLALVTADTPGFSVLMGSNNAERMDQQASLRQADVAGLPPPVPAIVIRHGLLLGFPADFPVDQLEASWKEAQERLAEDLRAFLLIADLSSNSIVRDQPDFVAEAIRTVATAASDSANVKSTLIVRRVAGDGRPLPGACFQIWADAGGGQRGDYRGAACDSDIDGANDGLINLVSLDAGDYVLEEIKPPEGTEPAPDQRVSVRGFASYVTVQSEAPAATASP